MKNIWNAKKYIVAESQALGRDAVREETGKDIVQHQEESWIPC